MFSHQAVIADHLAYNRPILLLDKTLIVFQVRASPCESNVRLLAVDDHCLVDELSAVIGIYPQNGKRKQQACLLESCQHRFLTAVQQGKTFRPPGCDVGERQRVQVASLGVCPTMGHQVCFQKAGSGLIPLLEGADGNLLLK